MSDSPQDRRRSRRFGRGDHGIVSARVRPGHSVSVVDVSAGGALVEGEYRLMPGAVVELHLETGRERASIRGRVLRCAVARLRPSSVCYRGAIGFDRHLPWYVEEDRGGYGVHGPERFG
jgi:hypothetical protein